MNYRNICFFDYETLSPEAETCQLCQIAGIIVDPRNLTVSDEFESWIKPDWDAEGIREDTLEWHAKQRKITVDEFKTILNEAPNAQVVWSKWVGFMKKYTKGKGHFMAPIPAGYNIRGFDLPITERYCKKNGQWDKKRNEPTLFSAVYIFDVMDHMWFWTENIDDPEVKTALKMSENVLPWMGVEASELKDSHDAIADVRWVCKLGLKLLRTERWFTAFDPNRGKRRLEMKGALANAKT